MTAQQPTDVPHVGTVLAPGAIGDRGMPAKAPDPSHQLGPRKPKSELRHWSTYTSVGDWYTDHRGYVPIQMAAGISRTMKERGLTFREAYALLLRRGTIIHVDPADDDIPAESVERGR